MDLQAEFNRQLNNLIDKGYPEAAGLNRAEFSKLVEPLKASLEKMHLPDIDLTLGTLPFVIVVKSELVSTEKAMEMVFKDDKVGVTKLYPHSPRDFQPIENLSLPNSQVYLLVDIDRGRDNISLPPAKALEIIINQNRTPLTIDEGIAIVTQFPEFLMKNNCFSLLASRHIGDQRVPAIWINASKNPNLGWCWDGNPHTWLGSASAAGRMA